MQSNAETFNALRVTLEAQLPTPALVVVSSARAEDGSASVACNTARAFADASYRTILIDTNAAEPCLAKFLGKAKIDPVKDVSQVLTSATNGVISNLSAISMATQDVGAFNSGGKMENLISVLKEKYDVIVVQTAPITTTPIGMQFARCADGVLMTVKTGRKTSKDDKDALTQLDRLNAKVLGVVMTESSDVQTVHRPALASALAPTQLHPSQITSSDKKEPVGAQR